jgi:hypothetical protein
MFIFLLYCFGAFPPCGAGIPLDAAASNAAASRRSDGFQTASSSSYLIDVSIYIVKDSCIFEPQMKQRLCYLGMSLLSYLHFGLCLSWSVEKGLLMFEWLK